MLELPSFKKIIILFAIIICFYIIYRLIQRRQQLLSIDPLKSESNLVKEQFQDVMPTIQNNSVMDLPLKEYIIFSSWNSCVDSGNNVSLNQLEKVMKHGCRFLDFEIYNIDGNPEVGYSSTGYVATMKMPEIESNTISFMDVCKKIASTNTPNSNDPLFLHLRIKSRDYTIMEKISSAIIGSGIENKLYEYDVNKNTILSKLSNKFIIIVDKTYVPELEKNACPKGCKSDIRELIGLFSGTINFPSIKLSHQLVQDKRPLQKEEYNTTNADKFTMVTQDLGTHHQTFNTDQWKSLIIEHKVQVIPYKFYYKDDALTEYMNFFSDYGHRAFIPMAIAHDALIHS